jgi:hypothetical protein
LLLDLSRRESPTKICITIAGAEARIIRGLNAALKRRSSTFTQR